MGKYWAACLLLVGLMACNSPLPEGAQNKESFQELVEMHCRARQLKDERFALSEEMRIAPMSGKNYDSLREVKTARSRQLADSIRKSLESLTATLSLDEKRAFNDSIEARIERMGCR